MLTETLGERDVNDFDPDEIEAFAAVYQGKKKLAAKKGGGKGQAANSPTTSTSGSTTWGVKGTLTVEEKRKKERAAKIAHLKTKSKCRDCGLFGHWSGDASCAKHKGKPKGATGGSAFFVLHSGDYMNGEAYVANKRHSIMDRICDRQQTLATQRGANGHSQWLHCAACAEHVCCGRRNEAAQNWHYLVCAARFHRDGVKVMEKEKRRRQDRAYDESRDAKIYKKQAPRFEANPKRRAHPKTNGRPMPTGPSSSGYGSECAGNTPSRNTKRGVGVEKPITHADVIGCMLDPILETEVLIDGPFAGNSYGGMLTSRDKRHMDYNRNLFEQLRLDPESVSRKQLRYGAFLLQ